MPKLILRLEFYMISGEKVETNTPLTSIEHARHVLTEVVGETASSIKLFTAEGQALKDDSPVPEDSSSVSIAIIHWTGKAK